MNVKTRRRRRKRYKESKRKKRRRVLKLAAETVAMLREREHWHADDIGRLHLHGTQTGRTSSSRPNLQNMKNVQKSFQNVQITIQNAGISAKDFADAMKALNYDVARDR